MRIALPILAYAILWGKTIHPGIAYSCTHLHQSKVTLMTENSYICVCMCVYVCVYAIRSGKVILPRPALSNPARICIIVGCDK
jgi:hypothetical protein